MRKYIYIIAVFVSAALASSCVDNELDEKPNSDNYPFRLILDADEGGDLPDAEDFGIEINFADYIGDLPDQPITLHYSINDLEDDMVDAVIIDKIIYEVELDDCTYEREIDFTQSADGLTGTITINPDTDLGTLPESFEIVVTLPGSDDTEGKFAFELTGLESSGNIILGEPSVFEYEVLDNDVAGEWELEIESEEEFESFKEVFAPLNPDLDELVFGDITGKVTAEFEFGEMKFVVELSEEEEVTVCEDGETETEIVNKEVEIEAEYDAEDGEIKLEGSHFILGDDGEIEDELDFIAEGEYERDDDNGTVLLSFFRVADEKSHEDGELFTSEEGVSFLFVKD